MNTSTKSTPLPPEEEVHVAGEMGLLGVLIKQSVREYIMMDERGLIVDGKVVCEKFPIKAKNQHYTAMDANVLVSWLFKGNGKILIESLTNLNFNTVIKLTFRKFGREDLFTSTGLAIG